MNEEARFDHIGSFLHIIGNRVAIKERGTGSRVDAAAEFSAQRIAVIDLNGFITGNARENQLSAAAVACEEVGGDAVDDDDLVSIDCMLIDRTGVPSFVSPTWTSSSLFLQSCWYNLIREATSLPTTRISSSGVCAL